jgi:hypothetical protein
MCVVLPNGRRCGLGTYVLAWRTMLKMNPQELVKGWGHFSEPAGYVLRELRAGMHDRINRHIPGYGRGRKWNADWQRAAGHCANAVNTPRLIVRWVPRDLYARLAHRITAD